MPSKTIRDDIRDEVADIEPFDDLEQSHITDALQWIDSGADLFRVVKPDKPPKHLVSYFALIDPEHDSLLLGDHINAQLWLPPGGHVEPGEHPQQTVIRETREELGREALFLGGNERPLFVTVTPTVGITAGHTDVSLWYLLRGNIHEPVDFERREFNDVTWYAFDEILQSHPAIFDPQMHRFTRKLISYLKAEWA